MTSTAEIIDYIKTNRVSTTEVADCLDKSGAISGVLPLRQGAFAVGEVFLAVAQYSSNWTVHEAIRTAPTGSVVVIEAYLCEDRALIGDLVSKYLTLYRQAAAIVVVGPVRDAPRIIREGWPVWSAGVTPVGCWNTKPEQPVPGEVAAELSARYEGAVAVCDDSGVIIIPKDRLNERFFNRLQEIEAVEDLWYECIDKKKWDTFDTVCLRLYGSNRAE